MAKFEVYLKIHNCPLPERFHIKAPNISKLEIVSLAFYRHSISILY